MDAAGRASRAFPSARTFADAQPPMLPSIATRGPFLRGPRAVARLPCGQHECDRDRTQDDGAPSCRPVVDARPGRSVVHSVGHCPGSTSRWLERSAASVVGPALPAGVGRSHPGGRGGSGRSAGRRCAPARGPAPGVRTRRGYGLRPGRRRPASPPPPRRFPVAMSPGPRSAWERGSGASERALIRARARRSSGLRHRSPPGCRRCPSSRGDRETIRSNRHSARDRRGMDTARRSAA